MSNTELEATAKQDLPAAMEQTVPTVTIILEVNELNMILGGLQELPHRVVDALLRKLMQQAQAQLAPQGE